MPKELFNQGTVDEPSGSDRFALSVPGAVGGKNFLYSKLKEIMRRGAADTWTASVINARPAIYQVGNYFYGLKDSVSLPFDSQVSPDLDSDNFTRIGEIVHNALAGRGASNSHPGTAISVDSSGATGTMPTTVATVQEFFDAVDALVIPTSTTIDVNTLEPYDPAQAYTAGVYRSYVNLSSPDPQFQTPAIYQAVYDVAIGQTPETHPYDPETDAGLWWYFGDSIETTTRATARGYCGTTGELSLVTGYKHNDSVNVKTGAGTVNVYVFDSASTSSTNTVKPADIATGNPGRWVLKQSIGGGSNAYSDSRSIIGGLNAFNLRYDRPVTLTSISVDATKITNILIGKNGATPTTYTLPYTVAAGDVIAFALTNIEPSFTYLTLNGTYND